MPLAARIGAIAAAHSIDDAPPELPQLIDGLQGWISTTRGRFRFGDGTLTPGHGKAVHEARNVQDQTVLFSQAIAGLRPTWDATTFDVPCIRSDGTQYLTRDTALPAPGLVIVAGVIDADGGTGFRAFAGARSTQTPLGDANEDAWTLNHSDAGLMRGLVAASGGIAAADVTGQLGEKLLIIMEVSGSILTVWQNGFQSAPQTLSGLPIAADGGQALLAKYYNDAITAIMKGGLSNFIHYSNSPSRAERRALIEYVQGEFWPSVAAPPTEDLDAGEIEQGTTFDFDVIEALATEGVDTTGMILASIDEQPTASGVSVTVVSGLARITVAAGATLGATTFVYCIQRATEEA